MLDGVQLPATLQVDGKSLQLNGFGLRTYSLLGIHIYIAALYLEHLTTDPEEIIRSPDTKLLTVRFERSVSADDARDAMASKITAWLPAVSTRRMLAVPRHGSGHACGR